MTKDEILKNMEESTIDLVTNKVREYFRKLKSGTEDINNFTNITEIERNLCEIIQFNKNTYLDITSDFLSSIDEKELIDQKKRVCKVRHKSY